MEKLKNLGATVLRIGVSIALLAFLFTRIDAVHVLQTIRQVDKFYLFLALAVNLLIYVACYYRWKMLLNGVGVFPSHRKLISSFSGGIFFNTFLPSTVGGDFVRTFDLAQRTQKGHEVAATVIMDRLSGYAGMMVVTLFGVFAGAQLIGGDRLVVLSVAGLTLALALIVVVLFNDAIFNKVNAMLGTSDTGRLGRVRRAIQRVHEEVYFFRSQKRLVINTLALSIVVQIVGPVAAYLTSLALGLKINILCFLVFLPIISAITLLPISTGGLGLRDVMTVFFFAKVGVARNAAFALSLIGFAYLLVYAMVGGMIYVLTL
ncbi:MAG: lysylphosphatidylglycerol synthase transmembrane domain-containing protein, partial [Deltaproteobacteria bacterium]